MHRLCRRRTLELRAAEIHRVGRHPQVAAIFIPLVDVLMGHRYYWPIYEACQALDLPVFIHVTGIESIFSGTPTMGPGTFDGYIERYAMIPQIGMVSVDGLISTLEKFPRLKFVFAEYGFLWIASFMYRMDRTWRGLRHEVPWVRKSPTEYLHERFLFTTQPLDGPDDPSTLEQLIALLGHDVLAFSTTIPIGTMTCRRQRCACCLPMRAGQSFMTMPPAFCGCSFRWRLAWLTTESSTVSDTRRSFRAAS